MRAVTIKHAKAHLNELIEAAGRGEQVVLMRGSKHVAAIVPLSADELEIASRVTDEQAERLWAQLAEERDLGETRSFSSAEKAIAHLAELGRRPRSARRTRARRR